MQSQEESGPLLLGNANTHQENRYQQVKYQYKRIRVVVRVVRVIADTHGGYKQGQNPQ
jgi:hypothetical protein